MALGKTAILHLCLCIGAYASDSLVSIGDQKYLTDTFSGGKVSYLRYPTIGCPAIVKAGETGTVFVKLGDGGSTTSFNLKISPTAEDGPTYTLAVTGVTFDASTGIYKVAYQVPAGAAADTYDLKLVVPALSLSDIQYNCFRVVKEVSSTFDFLIISDSHFNTPTGFWSPANYNPGSYDAYSIITQMKKEIRALNPTFVLLTGDLMFGLDYDYEYSNVWSIWKDAGFPIFMVPGNHDGYATIEDRWFLGIHSPVRDGLDYWRKWFGPCYYSFEFGGMHFQGVNSMDGTPQRRDGFLIVIENYGGDLTPEQQAWIDADMAGVSMPVVPYMHHNPNGGTRENEEFGMFQWVLNRIWEWITTGGFDDYSQTWNSKATADYLKAKYAACSFVFVGHNHHDEIQVVGNTTYKLITTCGASSGDYWGYCPVKVVNSGITDYLYSADPKFQSVPTGNLHVELTDKDGAEQKAKITSGLSKAYDVTVEFIMPAAPNYAATNGSVVQFASIDSATSKVWVKTTTPVAASINEPVESEVTVTTAEGAVAGSVETTTLPGSGGGGGGACGLVGLEAILLLGTLLLRRRQ